MFTLLCGGSAARVRAPSALPHFRHQEGSWTTVHPSACKQFFETARTVRVQQRMREVNVYRAQVKWVVLRMCGARPSALIRG